MGKYTVDPDKELKKNVYVLFDKDGLSLFDEDGAKKYSQDLLEIHKGALNNLDVKNPEHAEQIKTLTEKAKKIETTGIDVSLEKNVVGFRCKSYALDKWIDNGSFELNQQTMTRIRNFVKYEALTLRCLLMSWTFEKEDPILKLEYENHAELGIRIISGPCMQRILRAMPQIIDGVLRIIDIGQGMSEEEEKN